MPVSILRRLIALIAILLAPVIPPAGAQQRTAEVADAGEIHGRISVARKEESHPAALRDQMFGMYSMHGAGEEAALTAPLSQPPAPLAERAAVYLESDDLRGGPYPPPAKNPTLDQRGLQFHPRVLPILVGTRVDFPNRDNLFHNVFSYSQPREFDLGRYPKDDSRSVTFDRPGIVRVYCDIHSRMSATILVLRHPFFATPDEAGSFTLSGVPPGRYRIVLWYDRDVLERKTVEVRAGERTEVDFSD